jgi:ssDNA-binding Zn-finger/Zn-ribbon topoisomerase 1
MALHKREGEEIMALITCPECSNEVSDTALKCPKCGVQLRKPKRGFFGKLFKFVFIAFNIIMLLWMFSYFGAVSDVASNASSGAEQAGTAIGATLGTGMLLFFWCVGDVILGLLVLFTRPKK